MRPTPLPVTIGTAARSTSAGRTLALLLTASCCGSLSAGDHYVRAGATGDGSDWANAWSALPTTLTRGDTYWIASGSYGDYAFTSPASGTSRIVVRKAIPANHGSSTGWKDAYGAGQAVFGRIVHDVAGGGYIDLDGQVAYGIKVAISQIGSQAINFLNGGQNCTLRWLEVAGPAGSTDFDFTADTAGISTWGGQAVNLLVTRCYIHGFSTLLDCSIDGVVIDHCELRDSRSNNQAAHSNLFFVGGGSRHGTFRYNICRNWNDEGVFFTGWGGAPSDWRVYGNVFSSPGSTNPRGIELRQGYSYSGIVIDGNTFVDLSLGAVLNRTGESGNSTTGCEARDNLAYNAGFDLGDFAGTSANVVSSADPFVARATGDFHLRTATIAGTTLPAPYDRDVVDLVRGADGIWDVGAYEFVGVGSNVPPRVAVTNPIDGASYVAPATIALVADASDSDGTISKVEFYQGPILLGTVANAPYSFTWSGVAAGSYSISAKAYDDRGATATASVNVTVTPGGGVPPPSGTGPGAANGASHGGCGLGSAGSALVAALTFVGRRARR